MSDLYRVHFSIGEIGRTVNFEFERVAVSFAKDLEEVGYNPTVVDEFYEKGQYTEIYPNDERGSDE